MARIAFVAVTDDDYELTVFSGDTCKELAQWLGVSNANHLASALCRSKTGQVKARGKPYRYMRLNPNTGKIYVGKLPAAIREQLQADGVHSQRGRAALDSLIEEIADATIMLEQLQCMFGVNEEVRDVMDEKIMRLLDRAKKAEVGE